MESFTGHCVLTVPSLTPVEDTAGGRSSEADVDGRSLGEPLVKRERSDPSHPLQGI